MVKFKCVLEFTEEVSEEDAKLLRKNIDGLVNDLQEDIKYKLGSVDVKILNILEVE